MLRRGFSESKVIFCLLFVKSETLSGKHQRQRRMIFKPIPGVQTAMQLVNLLEAGLRSRSPTNCPGTGSEDAKS